MTEKQNISFTINRGNSLIDGANGTIRAQIDQDLIKDADVALIKMSIPVSWQNITQAKNNNTFQYRWIDNALYNVIIPDSSLEITDINGFMQFQMKQNGHYLIDSLGNDVYYLSMQVNAVYYRVTVIATTVPLILPTGWTNPSAIPLNGLCPQLVLSTTSDFNLIVGGVKGNEYPPINTQTDSLNFENVPDVKTISSIYLDSNFVYNPIQNNQYLFAFQPTALFGSYQIEEPNHVSFYNMINGSYSELILRLVDQNGNIVPFQDPDLSISLIIRINKL